MKFCPCCGIDLAHYEAVEIGDYRIEPNGVFSFGGKPIHLSQSQRIIMLSVMAAAPDIVPRMALMERMDSDGDTNIINVHLCRIRRKIREAGGHLPVEVVWGRGVRWIMDEDARDAA